MPDKACMTSLPSAAELAARHKAFSRERAIVAFFGYSPLIALYVLTHSSGMKQQLPESKEMAVLYIIVLPIVWFAAVKLLYRWLGPRRHRLLCPGCAHPLVSSNFKRVVEGGVCPACGTAVVEPAVTEPDPVRS
jgi:hypothetical protein